MLIDVDLKASASVFEQVLKARNCTSHHVRTQYLRVLAMIDLATTNGDLGTMTATTVQLAMGKLKEQGEGHVTCNHYFGALRQFLRFLEPDVPGVPQLLARLRTVRRYKPDTDKRHPRRALTEGEINRLLKYLRTAPEIRGMTGHQRAMLYIVAICTGLRANELRTLVVGDIDVSCDPPTIFISADDAKGRKETRQPVPPNLRADLVKHIKGRGPNDVLFPNMIRADRLASVLAMDLRAAGMEYKNLFGFADFHALRHSFGTLGAKAGVNMRTLQELMRHSDPKLTARYAHATKTDLAEAVGLLPFFNVAGGQA